MPTRPPTDTHSRGGWSDPGEVLAPDEVAPVTGPRYALGSVLGQGGMGMVHAARDQALGRDVALKELQPSRSHDLSARVRLAREAAITARLDHPSIVAVHEAGNLPDGRPYYTMRLVRGGSLAERAADTDPRRRLRHLLAASEAVAAAHDAGIVHRDLKPANILVGAHGETQVVDWGLAAPTPAAEGRWRGLPGTSARGPVGTDRYMSPEQRTGAPPDPRDDVYSLGVTLREVLGEPLDPELAAVVARATASPASARYADAGALAADLVAWFEGRRVSAHAYTPGELLRRSVQAYRLPLGVGAVGGLAVLAAVIFGFAQTRAALDRALAAESSAADRLADVQLEQAVEATRAGQRERAERLALAVLQRRDDPLARGVFASFARAERPALVKTESTPACRWSLLPPGGAWLACGTEAGTVRLEGGREVWRSPAHAEGAELHGDALIVWDSAGVLTSLDARTGAATGTWPRPMGDWQTQTPPRAILTPSGPLDLTRAQPSGCFGRVAAAAASGDRLAALCDQGTLILGDTTDPTRLRVQTDIRGEHAAASLAFTPSGELLVGTIRGRVLRIGPDGTIRSTGETDLGLLSEVIASPDGRHAALLGVGGRVGLWRVDTGVLLAELEAGALSAAFGPDGLVVHAVEKGRATLRTWRLPSGAPAVVRAPTGLADVVAAPDGLHVALAGGDGFAAVVDLRDGHLDHWSFGHRVVKSATFAGPDPWFTAIDPPYLARGHLSDGLMPAERGRSLRRIAALTDGSLVGVDLDHGLYRWPSPTTLPDELEPERGFGDLDRDGDTLVLLDGEGAVWRYAAGALTRVAQNPDARAVALRGETVYIAELDAVVAEGRRYRAPDARLLDVAVSADGKHVAASALDGRVWVWDEATAAPLLVLPAHRERTVAVEFLADGDLATASWDGTARFHDLGAATAPVATLAAEVEAAWGPG